MSEQFILDDIYDYVGRFVVFPSDHARVAWTLWVAHTYFIDVWYNTPRLHIVSAEKRCGKTTLLNITKLLVNKPIAIVNPTPASLYTLIEQEHPTLLLDEIDRTFSKKDTSDITSIVNSGFERGANVPRVTIEPKRKVEFFNVFGPMMLVGIDKHNMPDTIADRSIAIRLKRRIGAEKVEPYRPRKKAAQGVALRERLEAWASAVSDKAREMDDPIFPRGIESRQADKWEAIFVVADVADATDGTEDTANSRGTAWGQKARQAALFFLKEEQETETTSHSELILKDIDNIFRHELFAKDKYSTSGLLDKLVNLSESIWSNYEFGKPLSARGLGRLLEPHGIKSKMIRFKDGTREDQARGYYKSQFEDAWARYLPKPDTHEISVPSVPAVPEPLPAW
jgi:hypothetical protein